MIAPVKPICRNKALIAWHSALLNMLPAVRRQAGSAFRHLRAEAREEAVAEVVANVCCAVARLSETGKLDVAYPSVLAGYAICQTKEGRKVGGKLNVRDVLSRYCQRRKCVTVERLDTFDDSDGCWREAIVEDRRAGPGETARVRLDLSAWLHGLPRRKRRIAEFLALGHRTSDAARKFNLSPARIAQLRGELARSWREFVGDIPQCSAAALEA